MKKRLSLALAMSALVAAMLPGVSSAEPPENAKELLPDGGCPTGWELVTPGHALIALDWNGDTYLCKLDPPFVFIDNYVRVS